MNRHFIWPRIITAARATGELKAAEDRDIAFPFEAFSASGYDVHDV
jgi:hypothetical protein